MTKADLINRISGTTEIDNKTTLIVVEEFMVAVKKAVAEGNEVSLRGFGTFKNMLRHERNFQYAPGKRRLIPEHYEVVLKYCKEVRESVK